MTPQGESYRTILLTQRQATIVDSGDYDNLTALRWVAHWLPEMGKFRAVSRDGGRFIYMHRYILGLEAGDPRVVDHRNTDTLDNRRMNLRVSSKSGNGMNRGKTRANSSGYKGVRWSDLHKKWLAQIAANKKHYYLGLYETPEDAYAAYCIAALQLHGEFARLK